MRASIAPQLTETEHHLFTIIQPHRQQNDSEGNASMATASLQHRLRYVKQRSHVDTGYRATEKWMHPEARMAFEVAVQYAGSLVVGERPQPIEEFAPGRNESFYTAMAIGVRTHVQPNVLACGVE